MILIIIVANSSVTYLYEKIIIWNIVQFCRKNKLKKEERKSFEKKEGDDFMMKGDAGGGEELIF
jgi:hypothetical protein